MTLFDNGADGTADGTNNWLEDLGKLVKSGMGIYQDIKGQSKSTPEPTPVPPSYYPAPYYNPNFALSDVAFQPNWYLVGGGALLLIIVLLVRK